MPEQNIPLSVPNLCGNELKYVADAIESEWVSTAGPYVTEFENAVSEYVGSPGSVACQSGTAGLHVAMRLVGVETGDLVLVPTLTFMAAVNPVRYVGADPVFMDCDDSLCIDPAKVRRFCEEECEMSGGSLVHSATGRRVRTMVVVHVFGNMADMEPLLAVADEYGLKVIEDATEALGTRYASGPLAGRYAGTLGDMGVYSFNGNKIITTGGGGMIVSGDKGLLEHARHLTTQAKADPLYYVHDEIGYNYRLTNLQAALGLAQMESLEGFIETKSRNYALYCDLLEGCGGAEMLGVREGVRCNHWFYALSCAGGRDVRDEMIRVLGEKGIQARPIWGLIHEQKPYEGALSYRIECANHYHDRVVNVPCSTNLTGEQVGIVAGEIRKVVQR